MYLEIYSLFVSLLVYVVFGSFDHFKPLPDFSSHSCVSGSLFTRHAVSVLECSWLCIKHGPDCKGVSFAGDTGPCHGCSTDSFRNLDSEADGFIYKRVSTCIDEHSPDDGNIISALTMITNSLICPTVILTVDNGYTDIGEWYSPQFCPVGTYAIGFNLKDEKEHATEKDNTAINSVELACSVPDGSVPGVNIKSHDGLWGDWLEYVNCDPGHVLKAYQMKVGSASNDSRNPVDKETKTPWVVLQLFKGLDKDDLAGLTDLRMKCGEFFTNADMEVLDMNVGNNWGTWGSWSATCGPGQAICGLRGRVQENAGISEDDSALNDLVSYCC